MDADILARIDDGKHHTVSEVYDGTSQTVELYIDGKFIKTKTVEVNIEPIGEYPHGNARPKIRSHYQS